METVAVRKEQQKPELSLLDTDTADVGLDVLVVGADVGEGQHGRQRHLHL